MCLYFLGLVELGSNNDKGNDGIERKFSRSESEVYSDAVDDFPDSGLSQGVKQNLQQEHNLNSGTPLMSSEYNVFFY
jgi:hypothetical protein